MAKNNNASAPDATVIEQSQPNREVETDMALALVFDKTKSQPLAELPYSTKTGRITYSSIRSHLSVVEPELSGDAKTARVNQIMRQANAGILATVIELKQNGFNFTRLNGRELKSGARTVSIGMSNAGDRKVKPAKKLEDYTVSELRELLAKR